MTVADTSLVKFSKKINPDLPPVFAEVFGAITEASAGIAKSSPSDVVAISLNLAQRVIRGEKLASVAAEFEMLRKKGKIPKEYLHSLQGKYTYTELLNFLDKSQVIEEDVFQVIKKIFLVAATKKDDALVQQYMRIAKDLTGGEVLVLFSSYQIATDKEYASIKFGSGAVTQEEWSNVIAKVSGLTFNELVLIYADRLADKNLLYKKTEGTSMGTSVSMGQNMRLTHLGYGFCLYVAQYDGILKDISDEKTVTQ